MNALYYVHLNDEQAGPFAPEELNVMLTSGEINEETFCQKVGSTRWIPYRALEFPQAPLRVTQTPIVPQVRQNPPSQNTGELAVTVLSLVLLAAVFGPILLIFKSCNDALNEPRNVYVQAPEESKRQLESTAAAMAAGRAYARERAAQGLAPKSEAALELMAKAAFPADDLAWRSYVREYKAEWSRLH